MFDLNEYLQEIDTLASGKVCHCLAELIFVIEKRNANSINENGITLNLVTAGGLLVFVNLSGR